MTFCNNEELVYHKLLQIIFSPQPLVENSQFYFNYVTKAQCSNSKAKHLSPSSKVKYVNAHQRITSI